MLDRRSLLESLDRKRRILAASVVLTPVDSLPMFLADREETGYLHGLYLTDRVRSQAQRIEAVVQFGGRTTFARDLDSIHTLLAKRLHAQVGSLRLLSGLHAQTCTFMSIGVAGQTVLTLPVRGGGHVSTNAILSRLGFRTLDMPIDEGSRSIDKPKTIALIEKERPDFVLVDRSEGLKYEDFSFLGSITGPVKVFDASQYLPQILTGAYENPLDWGFDLMMFSTHKSYPGPQKAGIVGRKDDQLWKTLMQGLSTLVSSSHGENTYLFGLSLLQEERLLTYTQRMIDSADELEQSLLCAGVEVVQKSAQGSPTWKRTQHVWVRAPSQEIAFRWFESLSRIRIHVNYRLLPYSLGYGLRLGTSYSSMAGLRETEMRSLALVISEALSKGPSAVLRNEVRSIAESARGESLVEPSYWA
jgi:glycine hydroxymethyltransferase